MITLMYLRFWISKAWAWVKAHWKSVLIGVGTLGVGLLIGRALRKPRKVVAPELVGAQGVQQAAQDVEDAAVAAADEDRKTAEKELEVEHATATKELTEEQRVRVKELEEDPDALNAFLKEVGQGVRDGSG